jgi:hypothetical protein
MRPHPTSEKITGPRLDLAFLIVSLVGSLFLIATFLMRVPSSWDRILFLILITTSNLWDLQLFIRKHKAEIH